MSLGRAVPQWKMHLTEHVPKQVLCTDGEEHPFCTLCGEQLDIPVEKQFWSLKPKPRRLRS